MRAHVASLLSVAVLTLGVGQAQAASHGSYAITPAEVEQAQQAWGDALLAISQAYRDGGRDSAAAKASAVLDAAYGYAQGPVLFKPTLAHGEQTFRTTQDGALAYFVGGNSDFPDDSGFALKDWHGFAFENAAVHLHGDLALTMGHVMLTNTEDEVTTVDKTWGFQRDDQGDLRIVLHHSSLPFSAD